MWPPYGVAIICIGPVFLALEAAMWSIEDAYGTRTDIFVCMATSQLALVVYVLWIAVLDEVRSRLAEAFVFWLATLVAHIFSVCQPLWHSMRHRRWLAMQPSPGGFGYPYRGTRLRRSLYSSLYKEFQRTMEDCVQRERFLQFATHHYRSGLPAFLGDFQLLKYRVIEALQNHHGQPTIQLVNNDQHLYESHPLASTVPITKGIFESTMLLLPDGAISEHTQFPEAVKSTFSSFVCTYFGRESSMAISIPGDIVVGIQIAIEQNDVRLSILDRAKDEVLFLLCTDVFSEYRRRLDAQCADP
ncbi:hypothetical protein IWW51_006197 [Coemansia sp. RSA 2702]|nr:hypothetical protein IWW51_006197 [Coemansia sp. RSA 2702]